MGKRNYEAVLPPSRHRYTFHHKGEAIAFARKHWIDTYGMKGYVKSRRTGQITYPLHKQQTSCSVCGNELEGKQHCPLCGALHSYK